MTGPGRQTPAVVLGSTDFGDADRIVRMLTPDLGRISVLARRARSSRRRFGGAFDVGNRIVATLRPGRGELWHIDDAALEDGRLHVRSDLVRLTLLAHCAEACGALAREHHPEPRLFGLLETAAALLDAMDAPPGGLFRLALEAKALTFAGVAPVLDRCVVCGEPSAEPMSFRPANGGALHARCAASEHAGSTSVPVTLAWLDAVERGRRTPLRGLVDDPLPAGPPWVLADAIEAHVGRPLKARIVLEQLAGPT